MIPEDGLRPIRPRPPIIGSIQTLTSPPPPSQIRRDLGEYPSPFPLIFQINLLAPPDQRRPRLPPRFPAPPPDRERGRRNSSEPRRPPARYQLARPPLPPSFQNALML